MDGWIDKWMDGWIDGWNKYEVCKDHTNYYYDPYKPFIGLTYMYLRWCCLCHELSSIVSVSRWRV